MSVVPENPDALNIITLNCWGLKYIAKLRKERLDEIGKRIATATPVPNIVGLQECWTLEDYKRIRKHTKSILPYGKFYHSGIFGGGLAILSRWPIEESNMIRYPLNGRPTAFFRGDWFVGKGIACASIRLGPGAKNVVEVFCTHLHAPYEREPHDSYLCHRTAQAWEIAKLMRGAVQKGHLALGLGDFNMIPLSLAHRIITTHAPVNDVWRVLHPDSSLGAAVDAPEKIRGRQTPAASFNLTENGATCDSILNTWRWTKENQQKLFKGEFLHVSSDSPDPRAKRLDYIFFGSSPEHASAWQIQDAKVGMTNPHPEIGCSLSDHFSMEATIQRRRTNRPSETTETPGHDQILDNKESHLDTNILTPNGSLTTSTYLPRSTYDEILTMISVYTLRERRQRRFRLAHFLLSVPISIICFIAVFWSPHNFVSFILMLVSTLSLGAGIIDGLIGGLFVGSELRALKEFEWEIRNAKMMASGGGGGGDGTVGTSQAGLTHQEDEETSLRDWYD